MSQIVFKNIVSEVSGFVKSANQPIVPQTLGAKEVSVMTSKKEHIPELDVGIRRNGEVKLYPFTDFFKGFEKVDAVKATFGSKTEEILKNLKVEFFSFKYGYMAVSDIDGHLIVSTHHLKNSSFRVLYLDVIHELVHVRQFMEGKQLFNSEYEYVDNPTEIEAYRHAVKEAKRLGMTEIEIVEYLKVEWIDEAALGRLVESVGLTRA